MVSHTGHQSSEVAGRQAVMAICADAGGGELRTALAALGPPGDVRDLRRPESGLVMLRGRMGGDGAAFNLGEATATRAAIVLSDGAGDHVGFAYHLGRDRAKARSAAILDALWQIPGRRDAVEEALRPIRDRMAAEREKQGRQAAATRVNFFTLVRGED